MKNRLAFILILLLAGFLGAGGFFFYKNTQLKKKLSYLESKVEDLEGDLKDAKNEIDNLEEEKNEIQGQLDNVKHFDEGGVGNGYSDRSSAISFTGSAMQTKIDGEFDGWDGETIFKMMNGTIWQQASYAYTYHYAYMPDVLIYSKNGSYYMRVEDVDEEIRVIRIQ